MDNAHVSIVDSLLWRLSLPRVPWIKFSSVRNRFLDADKRNENECVPIRLKSSIASFSYEFGSSHSASHACTTHLFELTFSYAIPLFTLNRKSIILFFGECSVNGDRWTAKVWAEICQHSIRDQNIRGLLSIECPRFPTNFIITLMSSHRHEWLAKLISYIRSNSQSEWICFLYALAHPNTIEIQQPHQLDS